jgi:hypothetical protein
VAIFPIASVNVGGDGSTTAPINPSGATLLIAHVAYLWDNLTSPSILDSNLNTWLVVNDVQNGLLNLSSKLFYAANAIVSPGQTFTVNGPGLRPLLEIAAFGGVATANVLDRRNTNGSADTVTTAQPGAITPLIYNELVISAIASDGSQPLKIDSGYSIIDQAPASGLTNMQGGLAFLVQGKAGSTNPTWTLQQSSPSLQIASFKAAEIAPVQLMPQIWL